MAKCVILYWRNIPSMVEARDGDGRHKVELSVRFQELIDMIAMRSGLAGTDQYLAEWRRTRVGDRSGDVKSAAEAIASDIEGRYEAIRAEALAALPSMT